MTSSALICATTGPSSPTILSLTASLIRRSAGGIAVGDYVQTDDVGDASAAFWASTANSNRIAPVTLPVFSSFYPHMLFDKAQAPFSRRDTWAWKCPAAWRPGPGSCSTIKRLCSISFSRAKAYPGPPLSNSFCIQLVSSLPGVADLVHEVQRVGAVVIDRFVEGMGSKLASRA